MRFKFGSVEVGKCFYISGTDFVPLESGSRRFPDGRRVSHDRGRVFGKGRPASPSDFGARY